MFKFDKKITIDTDVAKDPNLCSRFSDQELAKLGELVAQGYRQDLASRKKWQIRNEAGMDFALQVAKDKNWPWQGCSNVIFPLITIAAMQFSSRAYGNIISGTDIVRMRVVGEDPQRVLTDRALRISTHMSWQVMEEDTAWEEQHDRLFINEAIVGTSFVKSYYDGTLGHNVSCLVMAKNFVLNYFAKSVESCPRKTEVVDLSRNDIHERIKRGIFRDVSEEAWYTTDAAPRPVDGGNATATVRHDNRQGIEPSEPDEDTPFMFYEQHRLLDLDHDGYAEPYIVTIEATSMCVCRIVARWDKDSQIERNSSGEIIVIRPTEYFTKYGFIPSPDGGIYDIGFGVLLGPLNEAVNTSINQLLDAGTMQNSLGGFLGRGAKIRGGIYSMAPWEWKRVDSTGDDLRKNVVPFPDRPPSTVLFSLLSLLIEYTNRVASTTDQMVGKTPGQNTPAETSRNALEQGMQVFSTIFKRIWRSMKEEFKKLHALNAVYLPTTFTFGQGQGVRREDYNSNADLVIPAADPNITSAAMRLQQAQAIREASQQVPGYDISYVERNFLRAMRVEGVDLFFPGPDKVPPPPNPKVQVAEMNMKVKMMDFQFQKQKFVLELMDQRKLNMAKILQLEAQAASLTAGIETEKSAVELSRMQMVIDTMVAHNQAITDRITALSGVDSEGSEGNSSTTQGNSNDSTQGQTSGNGGGVPSLESGSDDAGGIPADAAMAGGSEGSMG